MYRKLCEGERRGDEQRCGHLGRDNTSIGDMGSRFNPKGGYDFCSGKTFVVSRVGVVLVGLLKKSGLRNRSIEAGSCQLSVCE